VLQYDDDDQHDSSDVSKTFSTPRSRPINAVQNEIRFMAENETNRKIENHFRTVRTKKIKRKSLDNISVLFSFSDIQSPSQL